MKLLVLVPVKKLSRAKNRLSVFLNLKERAALASAMFADVADALDRSGCRVAVLTAAEDIARSASRRGWRLLWEDTQISESASVDEASRRLASEGIRSVLRIPADIPLVKAEDITRLLELPCSRPCAVLAPSWDFRGTNAILRSPPDLFASRFGPDSLRLHLGEAMSKGAHCVVIQNTRIGLDLDEPVDITRFLETPSDTETYRFLLRSGAAERIAAHERE
jgi:2-phospho-L-lactate guanylyltransferase